MHGVWPGVHGLALGVTGMGITPRFKDIEHAKCGNNSVWPSNSGAAHERRREGVGAKRVGRKRAYVIDSRKE